MKSMYKTLFVMQLIAAAMNLISFFAFGFDYDKLLIAVLEGLLAWNNYDNYKRDGV